MNFIDESGLLKMILKNLNFQEEDPNDFLKSPGDIPVSFLNDR